MQAFEELVAIADRAVDAAFSERFDLIPMREAVNAAPVPDETRAAVLNFEAIFDEAADFMDAGSRGGRERVSPQPLLSVRDEAAPFEIRRFDRLRRLKTNTFYEAIACRPDGVGRRVVSLVVQA